MHARAVDEASVRLRELRHEEWADLGLAVLVLGLAVAATELRPALAVPLFLGGLGVGVLGIRALVRRLDLVERLAGERDAYVIAEVLACALQEATMKRRNSFASLIRFKLTYPETGLEGRITAAAQELEALACELEDEELSLDPGSAVACMRLLSDVSRSPLLNRSLPPEDLRSHVGQIRAGFKPVRLAA